MKQPKLGKYENWYGFGHNAFYDDVEILGTFKPDGLYYEKENGWLNNRTWGLLI